MYRGEAFDSDLGLYYLRARYMNPLTGRFLSRDPNEPQVRDEIGKPIDPKELHKYLYAGGDPVNHFDPTGRDFVEVGEEDSLSITFGHGARHLVGTGLSQAETEAAIEAVMSGPSPGPLFPPERRGRRFGRQRRASHSQNHETTDVLMRRYPCEPLARSLNQFTNNPS